MAVLKVKLLRSAAKPPAKMTVGSAGLDLYAAEQVVVPPTRCTSDGCAEVGRALVPIGIKVEVPKGTVGRIASRSGLSTQANIEVGAGWIDSDYRGELKVEIKNMSAKPYHISAGDRIAQLVILHVTEVEVKVVPELEDSPRNQSGFGSTGR